MAAAVLGGVAVGGANIWNPLGIIILGTTAIIATSTLIESWNSGYQVSYPSSSSSSSQVRSTKKSKAIEQALSNEVSKAKRKINKQKNRYDYWVAVYVDLGNNCGTYIPTTALSYKNAISYVKLGVDVFADSANNAYKLARAVGRFAVRDCPHGTLGYWRHYHASLTADGKKRIGGHIFYV